MRALRSIQSSDKYPLSTSITGNHFHEIGVTGKQTSALFSATSCRTTFRGNVAYNGPRAGVRPRSFPRPHAVSFFFTPCTVMGWPSCSFSLTVRWWFGWWLADQPKRCVLPRPHDREQPALQLGSRDAGPWPNQHLEPRGVHARRQGRRADQRPRVDAHLPRKRHPDDSSPDLQRCSIGCSFSRMTDHVHSWLC